MRTISNTIYGGLLLIPTLALQAQEKQPNVIFILADDIGYGDFSSYGAQLITTPNIDKLANTGVIFTHAYAPCSTSSPSRYALLTGEYAWRKNVDILPGNAPMEIDTTKINLPKFMKREGYTTGIVGKWHLGLGSKKHPANFNKKIKTGMRAIGFDYSYIFPATNDRVPTIFIENDYTVGLENNDPIFISYKKNFEGEPTGKNNPELLKMKPFHGHDGTIIDSISRMGYMKGGHKARWIDETMGTIINEKAITFIKKNNQHPFFLYYAAHNAHEPRVANNNFKGKSKAGVYGDVIEEFDFYVGQIVKTLKDSGIFDNTIIIITSDNGPMIKEGYIDGGLEHIGSHDPYNGLRGCKYSIYEGGCRVPFIVHWGNGIKKSFIQKKDFCYTDFLSTIAGILGDKNTKINDSRDASNLFLSKKAKNYRSYIVTQNYSGHIALRKGDYKYIPSYKNHKAELYNLKGDRSEKKNLISKNKYRKLLVEFNEYIKTLHYGNEK